MKLQDYLDQNWLHITFDVNIVSAKGTLVVPEENVEWTVALMSTNDKIEFGKLAIQFCPTGTVYEELDDEWYENKLLMLRHVLSKKFLFEQNPRASQKLMSVLERRDQKHWSTDSKIRTIDIVEPNKDVKVTISEYT